MNNAEHYIGNELELFSHAVNWKNYYRKKLVPYIHGDVLEAGAGIGETTRHLHNEKVKTWLCLEPDTQLAAKISQKISSGELPSNCKLKTGTTLDFPGIPEFDSIIYIDVIEHIEDDAGELLRAAALLKPGGYLVILVPAHQWLYSPFDKAIGHYRRYHKSLLSERVPEEMDLIKIQYLDSLGLLASLANKYFLRKNYPTLKEVKFWDRMLVPVSKITDPLVFHSAGKSLIGIWKKRD